MKNKRKLTILFLLFYSGFICEQINSFDSFDKESFLIGTLDDYMGHEQVFTPVERCYKNIVNETHVTINLAVFDHSSSIETFYNFIPTTTF
jgi:hypothetical protein